MSCPATKGEAQGERELVAPERKAALLRRYWTIPERQIETSVVLARAPRRL